MLSEWGVRYWISLWQLYVGPIRNGDPRSSLLDTLQKRIQSVALHVSKDTKIYYHKGQKNMHFQHFMIPWVFTNPGVSSIQGILMIEPKMDFVEKVCNETWTLEDGKITVQPPGQRRGGRWCVSFFFRNAAGMVEGTRFFHTKYWLKNFLVEL